MLVRAVRVASLVTLAALAGCDHKDTAGKDVGVASTQPAPESPPSADKPPPADKPADKPTATPPAPSPSVTTPRPIPPQPRPRPPPPT